MTLGRGRVFSNQEKEGLSFARLEAGTDEILFGWSGYIGLDISPKRMELKGIPMSLAGSAKLLPSARGASSPRKGPSPPESFDN